jgi:hypothetical protein
VGGPSDRTATLREPTWSDLKGAINLPDDHPSTPAPLPFRQFAHSEWVAAEEAQYRQHVIACLQATRSAAAGDGVADAYPYTAEDHFEYLVEEYVTCLEIVRGKQAVLRRVEVLEKTLRDLGEACLAIDPYHPSDAYDEGEGVALLDLRQFKIDEGARDLLERVDELRDLWRRGGSLDSAPMPTSTRGAKQLLSQFASVCALHRLCPDEAAIIEHFAIKRGVPDDVLPRGLPERTWIGPVTDGGRKTVRKRWRAAFTRALRGHYFELI